MLFGEDGRGSEGRAARLTQAVSTSNGSKGPPFQCFPVWRLWKGAAANRAVAPEEDERLG